MKAQITLTVGEGKALIGAAIASRSDVQSALANGKVLLKGGTTVADIACRLIAGDLRISGRISPRGTKAARHISAQPHSVVINKGVVQSIDDSFPEAVASLRSGDVAIIGANALDSTGRAAIMFGRPVGGAVGHGLAGLMAQGCKIIIACGLEKLIPGSIDGAVQAAGIYSTSWSMGMAVGLVPLCGEVVSEQQALASLAGVTSTVIGSGGIHGAEGGVTMVIDGDEATVTKAIEWVLAVKGSNPAGCRESYEECVSGSIGCGVHQGCAWRITKGDTIKWPVK